MHTGTPARESMEFDVVIAGAGPAGLSAAIRLKQNAAKEDRDITVAVVEKGSEVGAHILSGAVLDPAGLDLLLPGWKDMDDLPETTPVTSESFRVFGRTGSLPLPGVFLPPVVRNHGCHIVSMAGICRWLAVQAEQAGVEIYPGMAASAPVYRHDGSLHGLTVGEAGRDKDGKPTRNYEPGMDLLGKYVILAEGARGSLSGQVIGKYKLDAGRDPAKYGIGLKELWEIRPEKCRPGHIQHTFGWPLKNDTGGGSFCYHNHDGTISLGFVVHLDYKNPYLSPYEEFQKFKTHPEIAALLEGGRRTAYGSRVISEGGIQSVPKLSFPGGALAGCAAGFVNVPRIKGNHNAMLTGMMAADAVFGAIAQGRAGDDPVLYEELFARSEVYRELHRVRNVKPLWSKFGTLAGGILLSGIELWTGTLIPGFSLFGTLHHKKTDAACTEPADRHKEIYYPRPDGITTFDRLTNVSFSSTNHRENQPVHLVLKDETVPLGINLPVYAEPAQRYCPAGVYEILTGEDGKDPQFRINAQNCIHCKTCDIKDPSGNIVWTPPEGGGGPNYPGM